MESSRGSSLLRSFSFLSTHSCFGSLLFTYSYFTIERTCKKREQQAPGPVRLLRVRRSSKWCRDSDRKPRRERPGRSGKLLERETSKEPRGRPDGKSAGEKLVRTQEKSRGGRKLEARKEVLTGNVWETQSSITPTAPTCHRRYRQWSSLATLCPLATSSSC